MKFGYTEITTCSYHAKIIYPSRKSESLRVLSDLENQKFITYLQTSMDLKKLGVLLVRYTGIRIGELCALRWLDIHLDEKYLDINATLERIQTYSETECNKTRVMRIPPKSLQSVRKVPIADFLIPFLNCYYCENPSAYFLTGTSEWMEPRQMQYWLKRYTKDCDLSGVTMHTLRHTFASNYIQLGGDAKALSEILGHSSVSITLNRYVHPQFSVKRDYINKMYYSHQKKQEAEKVIES